MEALRRLLARHATPGVLAHTPLPGVALASWSTTTPPECDLLAPTFALIVAGEKRTVLSETAFAYGPGQYLVAAADLPVTGAVTAAPFLAFVMRLDPAAIAALLLQARARPAVAAPECALAVSDAGPALVDAVTRMAELLERPGDAAALAPLYEREILWRLISGEQGALVQHIGLADSRLAHVGHAIGWIRTHYREPLRVERLAELSAMSISSFHRHFRAVTRMTPIQYQQHLRLHEARALLAAGPGDVASVGFAVGYDSASQFSREYRRLFGAPPGRDGERLRQLTSA